MNSTNIQQQNGQMQDTRSVIDMPRAYYPSQYLQATLHPLLDQIIRESAETGRDGLLYLDARDLTLKEKQLVLSHILESEEYDDISESPHSIDAVYRENQDFVQRAIDFQCEEVWHEFQYGMAH